MGLHAAAQAYFNKPLDQLSLSEATYPAALPAPNNYNPFRFPDAARSRRDWVLGSDGRRPCVITAAQEVAAEGATGDPCGVPPPGSDPGADWFSEEVRREPVAAVVRER